MSRASYAYRLMRTHAKWIILNRGVKGERVNQICARLARDLDELHLDLLRIIAGVDDMYQGSSSETVTPLFQAMSAVAAAGRRACPVVAAVSCPSNPPSADANARTRG